MPSKEAYGGIVVPKTEALAAMRPTPDHVEKSLPSGGPGFIKVIRDVMIPTPVVERVIERFGCPIAQAALKTGLTAGLAKPDQPRPCPTCDLARALIAGRPVPARSESRS